MRVSLETETIHSKTAGPTPNVRAHGRNGHSGIVSGTVDAIVSDPGANGHGAPSPLRDFWELTKPEISFLVVVSAVAGFFLASPGTIDFYLLAATVTGIGLSSGGSGALNHLIERRLDRRMKRTSARPLAARRMNPAAAFLFGIGLVAAGVAILIILVNALTGLLAVATSLLYVTVYTPLKRITKYNTLIGAIPGALPALGGWTAVTGSFGLTGWILFAILFAWQIPHFLSLAWMYKKDYARAGFAMLPVVEPAGDSTVFQTLAFTAVLALVAPVPSFLGATGWIYLGGTVAISLGFLWAALGFYRSKSQADARRVLMGSIFYIPLLVTLVLIDRFIPF